MLCVSKQKSGKYENPKSEPMIVITLFNEFLTALTTFTIAFNCGDRSLHSITDCCDNSQFKAKPEMKENEKSQKINPVYHLLTAYSRS